LKKTNCYNYLFVMVMGFFFILSMTGFVSGATVDVYKELGKVSDHRFSYPHEIDLVSCLINSVYEFGNFRSFGTLNFHRRF
jgi:hypothetical protein